MDVTHWEKRHSEIALYEVNQEYESQRFQLQQANRWADHAQRDTPSLCRELEVRNRLFQESQAKDCQEIQELRRMCCEETDRARQAIIDELSMQQDRNPTTVSTFLAQILDLQNKVDSLSGAREFLRSWDSEQLRSVPRSQSILDYSESQDHASLRFWIAVRYTEFYRYFSKRF